MQGIYMHSTEHLEVITTVLSPQGRYRYRSDCEKMVVVHRYSPHWPDELELCPGDVILVLSKHEEERWFGRMQNGEQGYFPSSCVMEMDQTNVSSQSRQRTLSLRTLGPDNNHRGRYGNGHILQALKRGSRGGGGGGVDLDGSRGDQHKAQIPQTETHRSTNLLHWILFKYRKRNVSQGATNEAFEDD